MNKLLLSFFIMCGFTFVASAQIEMYVEDDPMDYSDGGVFTVYATGEGDQHQDIHIVNTSGASQDWVISRRRIDNLGSWSDYLCWSLCFSAGMMDMEMWTSPASVVVADGQEEILAAHYLPSFTEPGTVTYRYYVGTELNPLQDSMDLQVVLTPLEIEEVAPTMNVSVAPNPASNSFKVVADGLDAATIKMYDVLGNVILIRKITSSTTIDVSEFRNGIYFVAVEAKGAKTINRKVLVRH